MPAAFGTPDEPRLRLEETQLIVKVEPGIAGFRQQDAGFAAARVYLQEFQNLLVA